MADRRLIVGERVDDAFHTLGTRAMHAGDVVTIGRAAELPLGHTADARVSRLALTVTATNDGWSVQAANRNGVLLHPWGLPARYAQRDESSAAPRLALRVVGSIVREHWVLLEDDTRLPRATGSGPTTAEVHTLRLLFPDLLEWPPVLAEWPPGVDQVAAALGVTPAAVRQQLEDIHAHAVTLGVTPDVTLADPDYVHALARAGFLRPDLFPPS